MEAPPVRYVITPDGYSIAYTVSGRGIPFVVMPTWTNHVREMWSGSPGDMFRALAERFQLVNYDSRGMGMSTRKLGKDLTLDSYFLDLDAVLERQNVDRLILLGSHSSALVAGHYAARHPDRVQALILMNSGPCWLGDAIPSLWDHLPAESWDTFIYSLVPNSLSDEARQAVFERMQSWSDQAAYLAAVQVWRRAGLREVLSSLHTPTLVLKPQYCPCSRLEDVAELASLLPNGRLALMESDLVFGAPGQAIDAIDTFFAEIGLMPNTTDDFQEHGAVDGMEHLTPREVEVLQLIARGATNREIADRLVVSTRTVERHITHIYGKIGARGRASATAYALRNSLPYSSAG